MEDQNVRFLNGRWLVVVLATGFVTLAYLFNALPGRALVLSPSTSYALPQKGTQGVALADMNGDGIVDLVALSADATAAQDSVTIRLGDGAGGFGAPTNWSVVNDPREFVVVDINGDGDTDIVVAGFGGQATILRNDGNASFTDSATMVIPINALHISAGDLNGNGLPDLVTSQLGANVRIFFNNGDGSFQAGINGPAGSGGYTNTLADLDGDGFRDIVIVRGQVTSIAVVLNNGDSTFAASVGYNTFAGGYGIALADLNGNGVLDAVVTSLNDSIAILLGNGAGGFDTATILGAGRLPLEVLVADLDGDGVRDILTPNASGGDLSFFRGLGAGSFAADSRIVSDSQARGVAAASLTGNGALDLAVNHGFDSRVRIFRNLSPAPPTGVSWSNFQGDTTPTDTHSFVPVAPATGTDSFLQINLTGGGFYTDNLLARANDTGAGANYGHSVNLTNGDSATIHIWTSQETGRILVALRLDTTSLRGLPVGIPDNDTGRAAFGKTVFSLEFVDSAGRLLGDTISKIDIRETFVYTIVYHLTPQTARLFSAIGFDTSTGSGSFRFWISDTYGATWRQTGHTVQVTQRADGGLEVTVTGVTTDLAGGLGGFSSAAAFAPNRGCVITRLLFEGTPVGFLRTFRDRLLDFSPGRIFVALYYDTARGSI